MPVNVFGDGYKNNNSYNVDIRMNGNRITDVGIPILETDVANKEYVDSKFQDNQPWLLEGNTLETPGVIGSLNDVNFAISRNNIEQLKFNGTNITSSNHLYFINPPGDEIGTPEPDGEIESNALVNRQLGMASLGASKEFTLLLGSIYNYITWKNLINQPIRIIGSSGVIIKKGNSNLFSFSDTNICYKNLNMNTVNRIINLANPVNQFDASTKLYTDTKLSLIGGTMSGNISMGNNKIEHLLSPTENDGAATKSYVDDSSNARLSTQGGILYGNLDMDDHKIINLLDPTDTTDAATKNYVDSKHDLQLNLSGGIMTGDIDMGLKKITSLTYPIDALDASNKGYVDGNLAHYLPIGGTSSGASMTGNLDLGNNKIINLSSPVNNNDAVNKLFVYQQVALYLPLQGGQMNGAIDANGYRMIGLATPTSDGDATNKLYVDKAVNPDVITKNASFTLDNTYNGKTIELTGANIVVTMGVGQTNGNKYFLIQTDTNISSITGLTGTASNNPSLAVGTSNIQKGVLYTVKVTSYGNVIKKKLITATPAFSVYSSISLNIPVGATVKLIHNTVDNSKLGNVGNVYTSGDGFLQHQLKVYIYLIWR